MSHKETIFAVESQALCGEIEVPGDKSITHRSVLFNSIANGRAEVKTSMLGRDNLASVRVMQRLGVQINLKLNKIAYECAQTEELENLSRSSDEYCYLEISGAGISSLSQPQTDLYCGNSGTTARLISGILAGLPFATTLTGDESLSARPMKRVVEPLSKMGASFANDVFPLQCLGGRIVGTRHESAKASAQVKSAILLAGLRCREAVVITEPQCSRDHSERMLNAMGVEVCSEATADNRWQVSLGEKRADELSAIDVHIPGDFSSAAFFMIAALLVPESEVLIRNVCLNPSRLGLLEILQSMGGQIELKNETTSGGEPVGDLLIKYSQLKAVEVDGEAVVRAIDEIPVLSVAAAFAEGTTLISGAEELRVKESDRLAMTAKVLSAFGCDVEEREDGLSIVGNPERIASGAIAEISRSWRGSGDHRIAMTAAVLEYVLSGGFTLVDVEHVETSFPTFSICFETLSNSS